MIELHAGTAAQVTQQKTKIYGIASQFRGLDAGEVSLREREIERERERERGRNK